MVLFVKVFFEYLDCKTLFPLDPHAIVTEVIKSKLAIY